MYRRRYIFYVKKTCNIIIKFSLLKFLKNYFAIHETAKATVTRPFSLCGGLIKITIEKSIITGVRLVAGRKRQRREEKKWKKVGWLG